MSAESTVRYSMAQTTKCQVMVREALEMCRELADEVKRLQSENKLLRELAESRNQV